MACFYCSAQYSIKSQFTVLPRVIPIIKGGLGNQLFIFSASLYIKKLFESEIILDASSGFANDYKYKRSYVLNDVLCDSKYAKINIHYNYHAIRYSMKLLQKCGSKYCRIVSDGDLSGIPEVDRENLKPFKFIVLDGFFQNLHVLEQVKYDLKCLIRANPKRDQLFKSESEKKNFSTVYAVHIRLFEHSEYELQYLRSYIQRAVDRAMSEGATSFCVFCENRNLYNEFSDLFFNRGVFAGTRFDCDIDEFLALSCYSNIILTQSTFGYWGAILSECFNAKTFIIAPGEIKNQGVSNWLPEVILPSEWITL